MPSISTEVSLTVHQVVNNHQCVVLRGSPPCTLGKAVHTMSPRIGKPPGFSQSRASRREWWTEGSRGCIKSKGPLSSSFLSSEVLVPTRDHRALSPAQKELVDVVKRPLPSQSHSVLPGPPGWCTRALRRGSGAIRNVHWCPVGFAKIEAHTQQNLSSTDSHSFISLAFISGVSYYQLAIMRDRK